MLFPVKVWMRLPKAGETITLAHLGEVVFYESTFLAGLRFPIDPVWVFIFGDYWEFSPRESREFCVPRSWNGLGQQIALLHYSFLIH